jgi:site-specific DNA-methyltransferase (cytosine-N4-specific)
MTLLVDGLAPAYSTDLGSLFQATIEQALADPEFQALANGRVDLLLTSPPFPLTTKKKYGNLTGAEYLDWIAGLAPKLASLLSPAGSIVIEIGNAWTPGEPVMSTLPMETLLTLQKKGDLKLCQEFVYENPARLPGPAQWVTVERIRVKDSFTRIWWLARSARPYADNRQVLAPYGPQMKRLLAIRAYNSGRRPSGHVIGSDSFLRDNGGAIPGSVLRYPNTASRDAYSDYCVRQGLKPHPARMPSAVAEWFVRFLTRPNDLVLDPFAGSNTTGASAERLDRRWLAVEPLAEYVEGSRGRFRLETPEEAAS